MDKSDYRQCFLFGLIAMLAIFCIQCRAPLPTTTVILVRHAERPPGDNPSLSAEGMRRSTLLADVLRSTTLGAIFATQYCRTIQTVQPLAERFNLAVQIYPTSEQEVDFSTCRPPIEIGTELHPIRTSHLRDLAQAILNEYAGKVVLVAGHSDTVPALIAELGGPELCPEPFPLVDGQCHIRSQEHDNLFILTISDQGAELLRLRY